MNIVKENFELHPEADAMAVSAAHFIASLFLKYFKTRSEYSKTKSNESIVKYHEYYRLATQYREECVSLFKLEKCNQDTMWGPAKFKVIAKNGEFPDIILKITNGYTNATGGFVVVGENPTEIYILVDTYSFIHSFKKSTEELIDTIKHELRHIVQIISKTGLPKDKVLNRNTDLSGVPTNSKQSHMSPHHLRDIEFKTNLHTYAFYIKKYLNKNFPKDLWVRAFKGLMLTGSSISNDYNDAGSKDTLDTIMGNLYNMRRNDPIRWKQFIKELYQIIFYD